MPDTSRGLILRSDDGTIHFIRQEILDRTKVTEPEMAEFCAQLLEQGKSANRANIPMPTPDPAPAGPGPDGAPLSNDPGGFDLATGNAVDTLAFQGPFQSADVDLQEGRVAASTVMCPGTMGLADFETVEI
jgi:hypothetical protein